MKFWPLFLAIGCLIVPHMAGAEEMVTVRLLEPDGTPSAPVREAKVVKSDSEWEKQLGKEAFKVLRAKGTERPFCGAFFDHKKPGIYVCAGCDLPLFTSDAKFDSGTGWPSFFQPFAKENITEIVDRSHGMIRTEILCTRCDGHLGHVFPDGPPPTRLRYCLNSVSMKFEPKDE